MSFFLSKFCCYYTVVCVWKLKKVLMQIFNKLVLIFLMTTPTRVSSVSLSSEQPPPRYKTFSRLQLLPILPAYLPDAQHRQSIGGKVGAFSSCIAYGLLQSLCFFQNSMLGDLGRRAVFFSSTWPDNWKWQRGLQTSIISFHVVRAQKC